jgi:hypothetical protein
VASDSRLRSATGPAPWAALARSIPAVSRPLAALALAFLSLALSPASGALAAGGSTQPLGPARAVVRARAASTHGPSVSGALASLLHSGAIATSVYKQDYAAYTAAKRSLSRLTGTRREELGAVVTNLQAIAAAGELSASRLPALILTLERNRAWWTTEPLLASDERVSFPGSKIIWEHYPGQGIEIQWLATFGEANGFYNSLHENTNLRQLLAEVIPLATSRAGGIAWEYMFRFDGGVPPWTSGLSQGTALQVLSRAYLRFKEPAFLTAAQQTLGIFRAPPPQGVRVKTNAGAEYAEYTFAPSDRILNGFIQSLVGLYEYTSITKDPLGLQLFEAGDAEARAEVPHYDTGAWSLYDQFGESNLNYHELLTEFLQHLCERTRKGPPFSAAEAAPPTSTSPASPAGSPTGGTGTAPGAKAAASATPIAADAIYCTTAKSFTADLKTPPAIALLSTRLKGGTRSGVTVSLSKISTVNLIVRRGSKVVWTNSATVGAGKPKLLWVTPAAGGTFSVTLTATDLAGNFATANGTIVVSRK